MGWDMDNAVLNRPPELNTGDPKDAIWGALGDNIWEGLLAYERIMQGIRARATEIPELPSPPVITPVPLYSADPIVWTDKIEEFRASAEQEAAEMTKLGIASGTLLTDRETWDINTVE